MADETIFGFLEREGVSVDLSKAYEQEGALLEEMAEDQFDSVPLGLSRTILDQIQTLLPAIDPSVLRKNVTIERILQAPAISSVEGREEDKRRIVRDILSSVSEAVADVVWEHITGKTPEESFQENEKEEDIDQEEFNRKQSEAHSAWYSLYSSVKKELGLTDDEEE